MAFQVVLIGMSFCCLAGWISFIERFWISLIEQNCHEDHTVTWRVQKIPLGMRAHW